MKNKGTLETLNTISLFLLLEILAFVSFGLSNSYLVFAIVGFVIAILIGITYFMEQKRKGISNVLFFAIPLVIFGIISAASFFAGSTFSIAERIFIPLGLLSFAAVGFFSGTNSRFDMSKALIAIYGGIALIVLISYLFTMIEYVPFYTIIHAHHYVYYDGGISPSSIGETAYFLMGFKLQEVSVMYFSLFPSVLLSAGIALFYISPKKEKLKFSIYAIYTFIGLIALITMPTKVTLITDFLIIVVMVLIVLFGKKVIKPNKVFKWIILGILIAFLIVYLVMVINAQTLLEWTAPFRNIIASNSILNRVFDANRFVVNYNLVLKYAFGTNTIIGFNPLGTEVEITNSILVDTVITSGILGLVVIVIAFVFSKSTIQDYIMKSKDDVMTKSLIMGFILTFLVYSALNYDMQPYIRFNNLMPFFTHGLFLVVLFMVGYMFKVNNETKEEKVEEVKEPIKEEESTYEL